MSADAIGRYRTMCFSIRPLCNPTLMIRGNAGLVSNEAHIHRRGAATALSRRRWFHQPFSTSSYHSSPANPRTVIRRDANPNALTSCFHAAVYGTGKSPSSPSCREQLGSGDEARVLCYRLQRLTVRLACAVYRNPRPGLGLVPRQYSSGGKEHSGGISKRGSRYLRTLLIHGARAVVQRAERRTDTQGRWLCALQRRKCTNVAAVA